MEAQGKGSVVSAGLTVARIVVSHRKREEGRAIGTKEMTCRWIRQGCIISLVVLTVAAPVE